MDREWKCHVRLMTDSNINLVWVILYRTLQSALECAPTLLCGLCIAGLIRGMIGPAAVRRWFTVDPKSGPVRAWLAGLLLPGCSFGVLPIAWELRRAGVPRATVLTFLLAAPLADPFSLIYAFQKLEVEGTLGLGAFVGLLAGSFAVVAGLGVLLGHWLPEVATPPELAPLPGSGPRRVGIAFLSAARGLTGNLFPIVVAGLFGSGLLAVISGGAVELAAKDRSWGAPFHMALVSLPFYVPTGQGTVLVCDLLLNGIPVGTVFVFFVLGLGLNLGTLLWISRSFGFGVLVRTAPIVVGAALTIGYTLPIALPNLASHAIDSRNFFEIESGGGAKAARIRMLKTTVINDMSEPQWFLIGACGALGGLALAGLVARGLGPRGTVDYWMTRASAQPASSAGPAWNRSLTPPQRSLAGMAIVLAAAVAGLYVYYPAPGDLLNQMDDVQVELILAIKSEPILREDALRFVSLWQRLEHKLTVAAFLRRGRFDERLRIPSEELRVAIEQLKLAIDEGSSPEQLQAAYREARHAATRCRDALNPSRAP
jgi:uncharacterized membrane protein YraQ (UPF0718 family)